MINAFFAILITSKEIHMHFLAQAILLFTKDVFVNGRVHSLAIHSFCSVTLQRSSESDDLCGEDDLKPWR